MKQNRSLLCGYLDNPGTPPFVRSDYKHETGLKETADDNPNMAVTTASIVGQDDSVTGNRF